MDLVSDKPFWLWKNGLLSVYPPVRCDIRCDVVVLGAGISGALIAQGLSEEGLDVVVVDKRDVGCGSTSASTALLQYEIDEPLVNLSNVTEQQMPNSPTSCAINPSTILISSSRGWSCLAGFGDAAVSTSPR